LEKQCAEAVVRLRRVYRRRNVKLTARQEKLQAQRDIYEMRASVLCAGSAFHLAKSSDNLTAFDYLRNFINADVAEAVSNASRAEKRYDESFRPSPRAPKPKPSPTVRPKDKKEKAS
jgi:hypothetical protein